MKSKSPEVGGFLQVLGLGDVMSAPASLEVYKKFEPCLDLELVSEKGMVKTKPQGMVPLRKFSYHLGHDKYGRAFVRNLMTGEWIMYDEKSGRWITSVGPDDTPPPK